MLADTWVNSVPSVWMVGPNYDHSLCYSGCFQIGMSGDGYFLFTFISTTALGLRRCSLWHLIRLKDDCLPWWRHQMKTFSALLAIRAGNSPVPGEFPTQRPVTRSFDVFFDLRLNKWLSKQWWGWWFETLSRPLWRHRNAVFFFQQTCMTITVCTAICVEI